LDTDPFIENEILNEVEELTCYEPVHNEVEEISGYEPVHNEVEEISGYEPVLGGKLTEKAVWVDESRCIGCQYCVHVASNTFIVDEDYGRARAVRQDGDKMETMQEAIDTCPVDCIHWVKFEEYKALDNSLNRDMFQSLGKLPRMNKH